jgi:Phytanoyl-CoA dioxygenase (PhyH)
MQGQGTDCLGRRVGGTIAVMLTRSKGFLTLKDGPVPPDVEMLQTDGYVLLDKVFAPDEVTALRADVERVFFEFPPDDRGDTPEQAAPFRYEMLNRSAIVEKAVGHPRILEVVEPLLGEDCHIIANTAWWQPAGNNDHLGRFWHIDSGPHVPRDVDVPWDARIPYPVFAVATHLFLMDCPIESGPTGVIPGSHTSGQAPPFSRLANDDLEWEGRHAIPIVAQAGDVALFVSDIWHRRMPPGPDDPGRMFIQCHYGRRDIAQRLRPTASVNHLSDEALARERTPRGQTLVGLHPLSFYDG